jgi:hypothetical protein
MKKSMMMAVASALVINLSSCNNDNEGSNQATALKIQTDIAATRATISSFPVNSALGLFVTSGALGSNYEAVSSNVNVKSLLSSGGVWTLSPAVYLSNDDATVFAYYPYDAAKTNGAAIGVEQTSQTDFMYGTHTTGQSGINNGNPTVNLTMKHALALVQFKMSETNYPGTAKLTKVEIANGAGKTLLLSEGSMNLSSGAITNTTGKNVSAFVENSSTGLLASIPAVASTDENTYPKVMVLPTAATVAAGDLMIYFTIDGKVYSWSVPSATTWKSGTKNTYSVTLSGTALTVGNVVITDWTGGVTGSAGLN